jgi:transposase
MIASGSPTPSVHTWRPCCHPGNHTRGGRRPWASDRAAAEGAFHVLRTECRCKAMPRCFGPPSTARDRYQMWVTARMFERLWEQGLMEYDELKGLETATHSLLSARKSTTGPNFGDGETRSRASIAPLYIDEYTSVRPNVAKRVSVGQPRS